MSIQTNWDWVRDKLENLSRSELPTMKLTDLPKQSADMELSKRLPENLNDMMADEAIPELEGYVSPDGIIDGSLEADFVVGQIVVTWTQSEDRW